MKQFNLFPYILIPFFFISFHFMQASEKNLIDIEWPSQWNAFGPINRTITPPDFEKLTEIPSSMTLGGKSFSPIIAKAENRTINFTNLFYGDKNEPEINVREQVILMAEITLNESGTLTGGVAADWWMSLYIDGKLVVSTMEGGNKTGKYSFTNHPFSVDLDKGKHIITAHIRSGSHGWKFLSDAGSQAARDELYLAEQERNKQAELMAKRESKILENSRLKVAIFGSSVAHGYGADDMHGWANRLGNILKDKNWEYVNKSVGGDKTSLLLARIDTDLLPEKPDIAIIGLSLANEGILGANPDKIYKTYVHNMKKLVQIFRKNGIIPIISNCYPHGGYNKDHYEYVKKFNEELSTWPVYSIDLMGSIDNGEGQWVSEYVKDPAHPNTAGHDEMTRSVPTTLFDSLISDDLTPINPSEEWNNLSTQRISKLACKADRTLHSHTFGFECRINTKLNKTIPIAETENLKLTYDPTGKIVLSFQNSILLEQVIDKNPESEHKIAVSYSYARREILLSINGETKTAKTERQETNEFNLILEGEKQIQFRNAFWYYSSLSKESIGRVFNSNKIPWSSLALYSPLNDRIFAKRIPLLNEAPTELGFIAE
jgi:lysophospholipase L1-like esterase